MIRLTRAAFLLAAVTLLLVPGLLFPGTAPAPGNLAPPTGPASRASPVVPLAGSIVPPGAAGFVAPPSAPTPSTGPAIGLAAPIHPAWNTPSFFDDAQVAFALPGYGPLNFSTVPSVNTIPRYSDGFWLNVTTDRPLVYANITIWGNQWPVENRTAPVVGFSPQQPPKYPMVINSSAPERASWYFDDYRFFWPGSTIGFNLSLTALNSTPETIFSASGRNEEPFPAQYGDEATWIFTVQGPWVSPQFNSSVLLYTSPDVLGVPAFDPNAYQSLQIYMTALAPPGQPVGTIPAAQLNFVVNRSGSANPVTFTENFFPLNHTTVYLPIPLGPYPNSNVSFNVTLWLPWQAGAIDRLYSPQYHFKWSTQGGWLYPNQGLVANAQLSTDPSLTPQVPATLAAGQPVNVTIHEPTENVSIASGQVNYVFRDGFGFHTGTLPMTPINLNTSYVVIPGLPPNGHLTFTVSAKDIFGNPSFSQNFTYSAAKAFQSVPPPGESLFFFEVLDVAGTGFVPLLNYTIANATWSESGLGQPLGFAAPTVPGYAGYLNLSEGSYLLTVSAFGRTFQTIVTLTNQTPFTVVFYTASAPIGEPTTTSLPVIPIATVVGLAAAVGAVFIVMPWFLERRKRIEEEQRRITL